jgi:D-3-phosphoglycerate dehydrogenase
MPSVVISGHSANESNAPAIRLLQVSGFDVRVVDDTLFGQGLLSDAEEVDILRGADAVVAWGERYPVAVLEGLPNLRVIARLGVGFDKIDMGLATDRGVVVTITPNSNHEAVAEQAIALIMGLAKSVASSDKAMRAGEWPNSPRKPIRGSTLGIVGLGRIGRSLAVRAVAMRMRVIATELYPDKAFVEANGIELVDLDTLLGESDFLSLHCPLNDETRGLMNKQTFALMKPDAALVNTARGGLVVEADLVDAIKSGELAGAGLDVFEVEPTPTDNPLYELDSVIVSPHIAGSDDLSIKDMGLEAAQCIVDLHAGNWPDGSVVNSGLKGKWSW